MAARSGMTALITEVRQKANVGTADFSSAGQTYWDDDMIQNRLDQQRRDLNHTQLRAVPEMNGGTLYHHDYYLPVGNVEGTASGTLYWTVEDFNGDDQATSGYTVDTIRGQIRFTADRLGTEYYVRAKAYDLNRVVADLWLEKAGIVAAYYSFRADNQQFSRSDWHKHCRMNYELWKQKSGSGIKRFKRVMR